MKSRITLLVWLFATCLIPVRAQDIVPRPVKISMNVGEQFCELARPVIYYRTPSLQSLAGYLKTELQSLYLTITPRVKIAPASLGLPRLQGIILNIDPSIGLPSEGYLLSASGNSVTISGVDYGGVFNGIQTLLQLFPVETEDSLRVHGKVMLPAVVVEDYPRFAYRGMHLDVARTFCPKEEVMRFIDNLSRHKINKFHWHLTDDEGWRVEIKSRPELAEVAGFRGGDSPVMAIYGEWDRKYGGYYTQDEIREVVQYAAVRNVEIIPEIDLPGHSRAAGKVYPHILCNTHPDTVASGGYDRRNVWCAAKENNYIILEDILRELSSLFPSPFIHIGGDEVDMSQWESCPDCRALMEKEKLTDGHQLEGYFLVRLENILRKYGKSAAVWNEAINGGNLTKTVRVHAWKNVPACLASTSQGFETVVMPGRYFYLDMKYSRQEPGLMWAGIVTTEDIYGFDFERQGFTPAHMENVAGVQGAFWSELYLSNGAGYLDRQTYPRICALAELGWTPGAYRDWDDFNRRMSSSHYQRLEALGINYRRVPPAPVKENVIFPPLKVTSSLPARASNPYSVLEQYKFGSQARTTRTCKMDDYILFEFAEPVEAASMEFVTGYSYLPRCQLTFGYAQVCYELNDKGDMIFEKYDDLRNGKITIFPNGKSVRAVRLVSTTKTNGETSLIIQPPKIIR